MKSRRRSLLAAGVALGASALLPLRGLAQALRQATVIVGSPPGGATDRMARLYAQGLQGSYATTLIVENRAGAGGEIAYDYVKRSGIKDGSLCFLSPAYPIVISPHVVGHLPYDSLRDFTPVAITGRSGMTFAVGPGVPAGITTLAQYLQWCRDDPRQALYAAQTGSTQHLAGAVLALSTGVRLENVSYKGDAPAMQDLLGGHVPAIFLPISSALPVYKTHGVRILAVARSTRSRFLPDVPTFAELGLQDMLFQDWLGVFVPAGTPAERITQLNQGLADVARSERGIAGLNLLGIEPEIVTPAAFAEIVEADYRRYGDFIARTHFREAYEKAGGR